MGIWQDRRCGFGCFQILGSPFEPAPKLAGGLAKVDGGPAWGVLIVFLFMPEPVVP